MKNATILIVDDEPDIRSNARFFLEQEGYQVIEAVNGKVGIQMVESNCPDLIITDFNMSVASGLDLCKAVKSRPEYKMLPIIMVTSSDETRSKSIAAGADDFISKPYASEELITRVRSLLRIKTLYDTVHQQKTLLDHQNINLQQQVSSQDEKLGRFEKLKRFLSPQVSDMILTSQDPLATKEGEITVAFVDLRGFSAFTHAVPPSEVMEVLQQFHATLGPIALKHLGTLGPYQGDGFMVFLNEPVLIENHCEKACRMALEFQEAMMGLVRGWRAKRYRIDFGIGISSGPATIGAVGFEAFWNYSVIGSTINLGSRLCDLAEGGEILVTDQLAKSQLQTFLFSPSQSYAVKGWVEAVSCCQLLGDQNDRRNKVA